mgnify:CR=1 FL=1
MTKPVSRRTFAKRAGMTAAAMLAAPFVRRAGAARPRVAVIGGGAGGATAARALAAAEAGLDVVLIAPAREFVTCFFSNLYIAGERSLGSLTHGYGTLAKEYGVTLVHAAAAVIDPVARRVRLADGGAVHYDRLVVSPGIGFRWDAIEGYGRAAPQMMPHAWQAGPQTRLLRRRLEAMEDGGVFLIAPPEEPYRCPTAPYERVSLVAHYFKRSKPKSRIVILDAKNEFPLQALFEEGWARFYPGMIEMIPAEFSGGLQAVRVHEGTVMSADDTFRPAVANIIPPQHAGRVAREAGLADDSGWCPVDPATFESTRIPGIHVIGDSAVAAPMPKAGYAAALHAELCAAAIVRGLTGGTRGAKVVGGACWTHIRPGHAVRERAEFAVVDGMLQRTALSISETGESDDTRSAVASEAEDWYRDITTGMFG